MAEAYQIGSRSLVVLEKYQRADSVDEGNWAVKGEQQAYRQLLWKVWCRFWYQTRPLRQVSAALERGDAYAASRSAASRREIDDHRRND
jgi:hypothetical protein